MIKNVERNYLEIYSIEDLKISEKVPNEYYVQLIDPEDFQLNKFFYKNIGKKHHWVDRLMWSERQWINYVSNKKVKTYVLKHIDDLVGYFELIFHEDNKEVEIAYLGILEEYHNKKVRLILIV